MKVLLTGGRTWQNRDAIKRELSKLPDGTIMVHGGCRGADRLGGVVAYELGFDLVVYPANWSKYGKAAGAIRNSEMLEKECPDLVLAFHEDLASSRGTKDMIKKARAAKVPVRVFSD